MESLTVKGENTRTGGSGEYERWGSLRIPEDGGSLVWGHRTAENPIPLNSRKEEGKMGAGNSKGNGRSSTGSPPEHWPQEFESFKGMGGFSTGGKKQWTRRPGRTIVSITDRQESRGAHEGA